MWSFEGAIVQKNVERPTVSAKKGDPCELS